MTNKHLGRIDRRYVAAHADLGLASLDEDRARAPAPFAQSIRGGV